MSFWALDEPVTNVCSSDSVYTVACMDGNLYILTFGIKSPIYFRFCMACSANEWLKPLFYDIRLSKLFK